MLRLFIPGLLAIVVSACVTPHVSDHPVTDESHDKWQQRQQRLETLDHWSIRGRAVIFVQQEVHNVGLIWQRNGGISRLKLEAPLSLGAIQLEKNPDGVRLITAEGEQYSGQHSQQLLYDTTGLVIPVDGLETWIKGIPHQQSSYLPDIDARGLAINIQQDGWSINYLEYQQVEWDQQNHPTLPRKLYMKHDGLALKIVLDQWQSQVAPGSTGLFPEFNR